MLVYLLYSKRRKVPTALPPLSSSSSTALPLFSTALPLLSPSSSMVSQVNSVSTMELFRKDNLTEDRGVDTPVYDLEDIASHLGVDYESIKADRLKNNKTTGTSDYIASTCVSTHLKNISVEAIPSVDIPSDETNRGIKFINHLPHVYASATQRPDVIVLSGNKVITFIEVQSSPMLHTERKAILVAKDFLRSLRNADPSITTISVFCFPNCSIKQCIIEIRLRWENLHIYTHLERFCDIRTGLDRLTAVIVDQLNNPSLGEPDVNLMTMSDTDLGTFGQGYRQMVSSTHVVVTNEKKVVKVLYCSKEQNNILKLLRKNIPGVLSMEEYQIRVDYRGQKPFCYSYPFLPHSPMTCEEAKQCLGDLLARVAKILQELRRMHCSHNDIRLENICFNQHFQPCLIDFDRCTSVDKASGDDYYFGRLSQLSCMYDITNPPSPDEILFQEGASTDFMQLGWMAAWLLENKGEYHNRRWDIEEKERENKMTRDPVPENVKKNKFIFELIVKKKFDSNLLTCLPKDEATVEDVIKARLNP